MKRRTVKNFLSAIIAIFLISACFSAVYALEEYLKYEHHSSFNKNISASVDEATPEEATPEEATPDETIPLTEEVTDETGTVEPSSIYIVPTDTPTEAETEQATLPAQTESTAPESNTSEPITSPQTIPEDTEPSETLAPTVPTETEFNIPTTSPFTEPTETEFNVPTTSPFTEPTETGFIVPTTEPTELIIPTNEPTEPETAPIITEPTEPITTPVIEPTQPIIVPTVPTTPTVKPTQPVPKTPTAVWNERGNRICGYRQSDGSILFKTSSTAQATGNDLHYLLSGNKKKTIILPRKKITIIRVLEIGSNTTLIANGATVYQKDKKKPLILNRCKKANYSAVKNIKIIGGKWYINGNKKNKRPTSTFRFAHAGNITLKNCSIDTNYRSHAVELIACKNVTVDKCKLLAKGKTISGSLEEALQIDIATRKTATTFKTSAKKYVNGQTCKNITVKNCTIRGSRGVCANRTDSENNKWLKKHHTNIKLINNTITGTTSEAVALHNAAGITVKNNKIYSKGKRTGTTYSIGLNIASFGKTNLTSKKKVTITGNTIKGGRQAIQVVTYKNTKSGAYGSHKFGTVIIKKNKLFCKRGKGNCILTKRCKHVKKSGNKNHKW